MDDEDLKPYLLHSHYLSVFDELEFLGCGSSGCVVRTRHKLDGQEYAVKKIPIRKSDPSIHVLLREVQAMAQLHHPNIVRYHQGWIEAEFYGMQRRPGQQAGKGSASLELSADELASPCLYIQMEYCPETLKSVFMSNQREECFGLFFQILEGLMFVHSKGIIHGDLSRNNIYIGVDEKAKIADFGLSILMKGDAYVFNPNSGGTPLYKAPEGTTSLKADIFSLGILLFEFLTAFGTEVERMKQIESLKISDLLKTWDSPFNHIIGLMISNNPKDRPLAEEVLVYINQAVPTRVVDDPVELSDDPDELDRDIDHCHLLEEEESISRS